MGVKTLSVIVGIVAALVVTGIARADAPLAGTRCSTDAHGVPAYPHRDATRPLIDH